MRSGKWKVRSEKLPRAGLNLNFIVDHGGGANLVVSVLKNPMAPLGYGDLMPLEIDFLVSLFLLVDGALIVAAVLAESLGL